jgi:hypothetical protein
VPWINSAIFSTLFYYYLLVKRWSPIAAFKKTIERLPDQTGAWNLYERGEKKLGRRASTNLDKITGTVSARILHQSPLSRMNSRSRD